MLYLASRSKPPIVPWTEQKPAFHTSELSEQDAPVRAKFTLPNVIYVGSHDGCGCGFRSAMFQSGSWPEEEFAPESGKEVDESQPNHEALVSYLRQNFASEPFVELYGCWDGELNEATQDQQEVTVTKLLEPKFHFHERGFYRVYIK